ncbi:DUF1178 family protein [Pandoraea pnomenusa]|uniref:DUF1178 family protein n=1 Tax=Pandoraea pnomenusa TaxID=93220 RepID=UPI002430F743|nr:DUF1178 family protein [Pandoraea pnomenusa]
MKVFDLRCAQEHTFEGWFGSEDDYLSQQARGLVACPVCGDTAVARMPSAPRLNLSGATSRTDAVPAGDARQPAASEAHRALQTLWTKAVRHVIANTEDVGNQFAEEARRIHYQEAPERNIRGTASREEAEALAEEGIDIMALPLPDSVKETLQ